MMQNEAMNESSAAAVAIAPEGPAPAVGQERAWLKAQRDALCRQYFKHPDPQENLAANAEVVDTVLRTLWSRAIDIDDSDIALVAVGGYGRGALFPHSDFDVLVLLPDGRRADNAVENFIHALWDVGIEPGHSVRTVSECVEEAAKDITVDTSLLEARLIAGSPVVLLELDARLRARRDVHEFVIAKFNEQKRRHERFQEAAYNLEPNIKESPGGLRDLQMVIWLARAASRRGRLRSHRARARARAGRDRARSLRRAGARRPAPRRNRDRGLDGDGAAHEAALGAALPRGPRRACG